LRTLPLKPKANFTVQLTAETTINVPYQDACLYHDSGRPVSPNPRWNRQFWGSPILPANQAEVARVYGPEAAGLPA